MIQCEFCGEERDCTKDVRELRGYSHDENEDMPICNECHELEMSVDYIEGDLIYQQDTRSFIKKYLKLNKMKMFLNNDQNLRILARDRGAINVWSSWVKNMLKQKRAVYKDRLDWEKLNVQDKDLDANIAYDVYRSIRDHLLDLIK